MTWVQRGALALAGALAAFGIARAVRRRRYSFQGKAVIVTGGSRGLGLEIARRFAKEGARVAICARNERDVLCAKWDLRGLGADVIGEVCDVRRQEDVERFMAHVMSHWGRIDVLVNN